MDFQNGFISALPYLCMFLASFLFGWISDWMNSRQFLSYSKTKKLMNTISQMGPALGLVGLSFVGCDRTLAIVWLCISIGLNAACYSGFTVSQNDSQLLNLLKLLNYSFVAVKHNRSFTQLCWDTHGYHKYHG